MLHFFAGIGVGAVGLRAGLLAENGELARRWRLWLGWALLFYVAILLLVYVKHHGIDLDRPPAGFQTSYALAFALFSAAMVFAVPAVLFSRSGCNTPSTIIHRQPSSSLRLYSSARCR